MTERQSASALELVLDTVREIITGLGDNTPIGMLTIRNYLEDAIIEREQMIKTIAQLREGADIVSVYLLFGTANRDRDENVAMFFSRTEELEKFRADLPGRYDVLVLDGVDYDALTVRATVPLAEDEVFAPPA